MQIQISDILQSMAYVGATRRLGSMLCWCTDVYFKIMQYKQYEGITYPRPRPWHPRLSSQHSDADTGLLPILNTIHKRNDQNMWYKGRVLEWQRTVCIHRCTGTCITQWAAIKTANVWTDLWKSEEIKPSSSCISSPLVLMVWIRELIVCVWPGN